MTREQLMKIIKEKSEVWKNMKRKTEVERKRAREYYDEEIMPLVIKKFLAAEKGKADQSYDYFIVIVGSSYQPIVLSILALEPEKVLFLVTENSEKVLNKIIEFTELLPTQYSRRIVDKDKTTDVYQTVRNFYEKNNSPNQIAVDFTGGTKAMSAGAAMAGSLIGANFFYVSSDYLPQFSASEPGSEKLTERSNPYEVFGDLEKERALELWRDYNYEAAADKFADLADKAQDPREYRVLNLLADAYANWEKFNLEEAITSLKAGIDKARQYDIYEEYISLLSTQLTQLKKLKEFISVEEGLEKLKNIEGVKGLLFSLYTSALRKEEDRRYDIASLLLYRVLEMMAQRRLAVHGISVFNPQLTQEKKEEVVEKVNQIIADAGDYLSEWESVPGKLSCINSYLLLAALDDPISEVTVNWGWLMNTVKTRNESMLAHGFKFISRDDYSSFKQLVKKILNKFCEVEEVGFEKLVSQFKFIKF